jgi:hypothetical protein
LTSAKPLFTRRTPTSQSPVRDRRHV